MKIGIPGTGHIGSTLVTKLSAAGHEVKVANSRGPETIDADILKNGARAVTSAEADNGVDVVVMSTPLGAIPRIAPLFADVPAETIVIDTSNYYPKRDGEIAATEGEQRVGYIAVTDIAAVTAKGLRDGPEHHALKNYYLSTETMTGHELAIMLSEVLGRTITCDVRHPADMFKAGGLKVEDWYAKSSIEFCTQLADGRLGYFGTVRDDIPYLLGRPGASFRAWATAHRAELLDLVDQRADETPTE